MHAENRMNGAVLPVGLLALLVCNIAAGEEYHVSPSGDDANDGSLSSKLRTISAAANLALPGDTVTVHEGIYRERVNPPRGGTGDDARITYQAASGGGVVIKGSEVVTGWQHVTNDTWSVTLSNKDFFGTFNPFNNVIMGDWFKSNGRTLHTGAVYLNGHWLVEGVSKSTVLSAAGNDPLWFAEVEGGGYLLNVNWFQLYAGDEAGTQIDAFDFSNDMGIVAAPASEGGDCLAYIECGDWACYSQIDFGNVGVDRIEFRVAANQASSIEIRRDSPDGPLLGTCPVAATGGLTSWQTVSAQINETSGTHDMYLIFRSASWETNTTTIWAQFPDVNPCNELVEVNARQTVFYPSETGKDYITVKGFILEQAATPWSPPSAEQIGLVGPHWSKGWVIEDNIVRYSTCAGVSLGKYGDHWDNRCTQSGNYAENFRGYISRAPGDGWNQSTVGGHLVSSNHIYHCEQAGIVGCMGASFSTIDGNLIHDIYQRRLFSGAEMALIKFHGAVDTVISRNHIYGGDRGLWLDWMSQGVRVTRNLIYGNSLYDLFLEVNHGPMLVDHNIFLSGASVYDRSQGTAFAHNLFAGAVNLKPELTRTTPYLEPHDTTVVAYLDHAGGDDRFYNNIFAGSLAGLPSYSNTARTCWMDGNVFLDGATPAAAIETSPLVVPGFDAQPTVVREDDGYYLEVQLDTSWGSSNTRSQVTSTLLGSAEVPGQRFEMPDGTDYVLETDFAGTARSTNPFPGPFEATQSGLFRVKVSSLLAPAPPAPLPGSPELLLEADFLNNSAGPGLELGSGYGSPSVDYEGDFSITSGINSRIYLATTESDYSRKSFVFEADVAMPNNNNAWSSAFFGMGTPEPNPARYGEPGSPNALLVLRPDTGRLESRCNGATKTEAFDGGISNNNHRLRMIFDCVTQIAQFEVDIGDDGTIDHSFEIDVSANGFDSSNAQLIFGGGNGVSFDNISITLYTLDDLALSIVGFDGSCLSISVRGLHPSKTYVLRRSTNLVDGFSQTVGDTFYLKTGTIELVDPSPPDAKACFYRVEQQ